MRVLQLGPGVGSQGGMASVIEEYLGMDLPGITMTAWTTWVRGRPIRSAILTICALFIIFARRTDVVHIHLSERGSFIREGSLVVAASLLSRKVVVTLHGADFETFVAAHKRLVRFVLGHANTVLCLGPRTEALLTSISIRAVTRVVLNPVVVPSPARSNWDSIASSRVLFAGEVGERKGFDRLIRAWPLVRDLNANATLTVCGPLVSDYPELQSEVAEAAGIEYLGPISRSSVAALLLTTAVCVLPSRREVLPMALLEAMAAAVPVIAADCGEVESLRATGGALVLTQDEADDPARLAAAICWQIETSPGDRLDGNSARSWVKKNASASSVGSLLVKVYNDLA